MDIAVFEWLHCVSFSSQVSVLPFKHLLFLVLDSRMDEVTAFLCSSSYWRPKCVLERLDLITGTFTAVWNVSPEKGIWTVSDLRV